jgi:hypothetical protein
MSALHHEDEIRRANVLKAQSNRRSFFFDLQTGSAARSNSQWMYDRLKGSQQAARSNAHPLFVVHKTLDSSLGHRAPANIPGAYHQ